MNRDETGRNGLSNSDLRRRGVARVVPLPDDGQDASLAVVVLIVSATIAVVASALMTTFF